MQKINKYFILFFISFFSQICLALNINVPTNLQDKISLSVLNLNNQQESFNYKPETPRLLASNMKLFTTFVGLNVLGANYTWQTKLAYTEKISHKSLNGNLYLIGGGDPTLTSLDINNMLQQLKQSGINKIKGNFYLDDSLISELTTTSELHPEPFAGYEVNPDGLLIDKHISNLKIYLDESNVFMQKTNFANYQIENNLSFYPSKSCSNLEDYIQLESKTIDDVPKLALTGKIPSKCNNSQLELNLLSAREYNLQIIANLLESNHIVLDGTIKYQNTKAKKHTLITHNSAMLKDIIITMNHVSDNTIAKTITLFSDTTSPQAALKKYSATLNNKLQINLTIENGSGLSRIEKTKTSDMITMLKYVYNSKDYNVFLQSLPVAGKSGSTLQYSFPTHQHKLYAKTGSLSDVQAYSGYYMSNNGHVYAISFIANDLKNNDRGDFKTLVNNLLNQLNQ